MILVAAGYAAAAIPASVSAGWLAAWWLLYRHIRALGGQYGIPGAFGPT